MFSCQVVGGVGQGAAGGKDRGKGDSWAGRTLFVKSNYRVSYF